VLIVLINHHATKRRVDDLGQQIIVKFKAGGPTANDDDH